MPRTLYRCMVVSLPLCVLVLLPFFTALAATEERISKYGSLGRELEDMYPPEQAEKELQRFKAGGMVWAHDIGFFGLISINVHGKATRTMLDVSGLESVVVDALTKALPGTRYMDILSPDVREDDIDYTSMGYVEIAVWLVPEKTRVAYYIEFNACKEELEEGQGGPWYEYALGIAEQESVAEVVRSTATAMVDSFAADFVLVKSSPPVDGYLSPFSPDKDPSTLGNEESSETKGVEPQGPDTPVPGAATSAQ